MSVTCFSLNPDLDIGALAREYASAGRVRVHDLLDRGAVAELRDYLEGHDGWWQMINTAAGVIELDRAARAAMAPERRAALDEEINARARAGFQYRYEALRVPDDELDEEDDPLTAFARLMSSPPMLDFLRAVTGHAELSFTDGQATAYGPGDFLTGHDDDVAGKNRLAAYVFGMTPRWRPEWGGLLLFHDAPGRVAGHVPMFNTLDLFGVPKLHSVSMVTAAAPYRRYAVTGWLRSGAPEA